MNHNREAPRSRRSLSARCCDRQGIGRDQLRIHADRGQAMISKSVAFLLADLGRPRPIRATSNDNPHRGAVQNARARPAWTASRFRMPGLTARAFPLVQHRTSSHRPWVVDARTAAWLSSGWRRGVVVRPRPHGAPRAPRRLYAPARPSEVWINYLSFLLTEEALLH